MVFKVRKGEGQFELGLGETPEPEQLALFEGLQTAYLPEDYIESISNKDAFELVLAWPAWSAHGCVLVGPRGSGKSHLASIWAQKANAHTFFASSFGNDDLRALEPQCAVLIENFDGVRSDEDALFHLLNRVRAGELYALLVATKAPEAWGLERQDLLSRVRMLPRAQVFEADENLMRTVLVKLFHDRGLLAEPDWIEMILKRLPRSLGVARAFVAHLDGESLRRQSKINKTTLNELLPRFEVL